MNSPLRKSGAVMTLLFVLLFAWLNWVQVVKADEYRTNDEHNRTRLLQREYERPRGQIIVDGEAVALSIETPGETLRYQRNYPKGALYAHLVGYRPVNLGAEGLELLENEFLNGTSSDFAGDRLWEMLTGQQSTGGNLLLTVRKGVQEAAYNGLLKNKTPSKAGAVVAIDPETGAILALVSTPSFDPNPLVSHEYQAAYDAARALDENPARPLANRALRERFPPGSTFKVLVAAAAVRAGLTPQTELVGSDEYLPPTASVPITNVTQCPEKITLQHALRVSCNTAFARLGVEQLGADRIKAMAQAFGFETAPTFDRDDRNVLRVASSVTGPIANPDGSPDPAVLAQSCIGQNEVAATPLQMALVAATIANNGVQMRPYLIDTLQGPDLNPKERAKREVLRQPISANEAAMLREMMNSVVASGTGINARISGFEVGGKTGTAETGLADSPDHGWFIGYARKDGRPIVAVAVLLQNAGPGGSAEAAKLGGQVMRAAIDAKGIR